MTRIVTVFAFGIAAAAWLSWPLWLALLLVCLGLWYRRPGRLLLVLAAAASGVLWFGQNLETYRALSAATSGDLDAIGYVVGLPRRDHETLRFEFRVAGAGQALEGARIRLTWIEPDGALVPGERLRLAMRARPARGLANPGQFDFEAWAYARQLHATGYVKRLRRLNGSPQLSGRLDRLRDKLSQALRRELGETPARRLLPALAVADRRGMDEADWAIFRATGTSHLLAISGLHIGLCAGFGYLLGKLLWRLCPRPIPARSFALAPALAMAATYAALAGFSVPTVRALIMFATVCAVWWARGRAATRTGLAWGACGVLVTGPEAVADAGFWLSFGAVAALVVGFHGRQGSRRWAFVRAQAIVLAGLLPLTACFGLGQSWSAPLANLLAIPWVGLLVVPPLLIGVAFLGVDARLAHPFLAVAAQSVDLLHVGLSRVAAWSPALSIDPGNAGWVLLGVAMLFLPPGIPGRWLGTLALVGGLFSSPQRLEPGVIDIHVLDVGQGLALVLRTRTHTLLYDVGPRSRSGWSAGAQVVVPFLRDRGWLGLDLAVISHGDLDHAGGLPAVAGAAMVRDVRTSVAGALARQCLAGARWQWDGVGFEFLHPTPGLPYLGNDSSCVLLIESDGARLLLPGDASAAVESRIIRRVENLAGVVAAHHGSRSSSSAEFVAAARPHWVVYSAGHRNRYAMPHPEVLDRFATARQLHTGVCGYLHLRMGPDGIRLVRAERAHRRRPWHPAAQDAGGENQYDCGLR